MKFKKYLNNKGEVASLLTVFSMMVIGLGLIIGYNVSQSNKAQTTRSEAQEAPQGTPTPSPIFHEGNTQWFEGGSQKCNGWFNCSYDPHIKKLELRSKTSSDVMVLDADLSGRTPVGKNIGASCANRVLGLSVEYDPAVSYTDIQKRNIKASSGIDFNPAEHILLSVRPKSTETIYYVYNRPAWALGSGDVDFYFAYDVQDAGVTKTHAQSRLVPGGCVQVTPTTVPSTTPTPSAAPTATPTPVQTTFGCFEPTDLNAKGCRNTSFSRCEPTNEAGERLECLEVSVVSGGQGQPVPGDPTTQNDGSDADQPSGIKRLNIPTAIGDCGGGDDEVCRCLPRRCVNEDCTSYTKACLAPSPTPTATPSPTPELVACTYEALAFIEECEVFNSDGSCAVDTTTGRFKAKPIESSVLSNQWSPLNNKAYQFGRYFKKNPDGTPVLDAKGEEVLENTEAIRFNNMGSNPSEQVALIEKYRFLTGEMFRKGMTYVEFSDSVDLPPGSNPLTADIKINSKVAEDDIRAQEQYSNPEDSHVKFYFDKTNYRVVPDGNKLYSCVNDLKNIKNGTSACKNTASPKVDEVHGMTVGCGQEIVYGVTLQKCDFNYDYVFVVDTSSSMYRPEDDDVLAEGPDKLTAVTTQLRSFIQDIQKTGPDSRVAVVHFNTGVNFDENNTAGWVVQNFTPISDQQTLLNAVSYSKLRGLAKEGTCVQCGLKAAKNLVQSGRGNSTRRPVVVLLTDGNTNSIPGNPPADDDQQVFAAATAIKEMNDRKLTLVAIGYGNVNGTLTSRQRFDQMIKAVASDRRDGTKWAYSTDPVISQTAGSIDNLVEKVQSDLNTCAVADLAQLEFLKAADINKDGVINSLDLLMLYDNYFARGENIPEDVNKDRAVNALDSSLVIQNYGKTVELATSGPVGGLTNPVGLETTPSN